MPLRTRLHANFSYNNLRDGRQLYLDLGGEHEQMRWLVQQCLMSTESAGGVTMYRLTTRPAAVPAAVEVCGPVLVWH